MKQLNPISASPLSDIKKIVERNTIAHTHKQKEITGVVVKLSKLSNVTVTSRDETKFAFSYFNENFAKICFAFLERKLTKSYENNEHFREKWHGKRICRETSEFQEANQV
jgi:hypothetical protein